LGSTQGRLGDFAMKRVIGSLMVALFWTAAGFGADEKDLNGTWVATEAKQDGESLPDDFVKSAKVVFAGGKYTASLGEVTEEGTFEVDRSKKPNTIDMKPRSGGKKGKTMLGVFELKGDTLTICWNLGTNRRPGDLTSTAQNKNF